MIDQVLISPPVLCFVHYLYCTYCAVEGGLWTAGTEHSRPVAVVVAVIVLFTVASDSSMASFVVLSVPSSPPKIKSKNPQESTTMRFLLLLPIKFEYGTILVLY
jgi:hypothetical protein